MGLQALLDSVIYLTIQSNTYIINGYIWNIDQVINVNKLGNILHIKHINNTPYYTSVKTPIYTLNYIGYMYKYYVIKCLI